MTTKTTPNVTILLTPRIELDYEDLRREEYGRKGYVHEPPQRKLRRVVHVRMEGTANRIDWKAQGAFKLSEDGSKWVDDHRNYLMPGRSPGFERLPESAGKIAWAEVRAVPESAAMRALLDKHAREWDEALCDFRNRQMAYANEQLQRAQQYKDWTTNPRMCEEVE